MRGVFIVFEGVEGGGKSTQIAMLAERLRKMGFDVETTREPGGTQVGAAIRKILLSPDTGALDPMTELLLFSAARSELLASVIKPAIEDGRVVLCDRFSDSTMAYQGYGRGLDKELIEDLTGKVVGGFSPDRVVVMDLPVEDGLARAGGRMVKEGRGEARFEDESLEFHRRVRDGFLKIAEAAPERVRIVDSTKSVEDVHEAVFNSVKDVLPKV